MICIDKCVVLALKQLLAQCFDALEQLASLKIVLYKEGDIGSPAFLGIIVLSHRKRPSSKRCGKELIVYDTIPR